MKVTVSHPKGISMKATRNGCVREFFVDIYNKTVKDLYTGVVDACASWHAFEISLSRQGFLVDSKIVY